MQEDEVESRGSPATCPGVIDVGSLLLHLGSGKQAHRVVKVFFYRLAML